MEKKSIKINNIEFEFFYDEHLNMWRIIENPNLIDGQNIDIEIDLANFKNSLDWLDITKFIESIKNNNTLFVERVGDAKEVLKSLFKSINKKVYEYDFYEHLEFNLAGIDFKGYCKNINLSDKFEYDYFFFPQYTKDPYRDIGSFVWRANFRDTLLLGVYCDRI